MGQTELRLNGVLGSSPQTTLASSMLRRLSSGIKQTMPLPLHPREETESGSKEGGDEEVSKPALIVVWVQAAGVDLQDVELRYTQDPQRPSSLPNRRPELRLAREAARAGACAAEALVVDAPPKGFYVSVAGCRGPYDFEQLPCTVVHTPCVAS